MNVTVKDIDFLQGINPENVAIYLQNNGWNQHKYIENQASIWLRENETNESVQIILPLVQETPGFPISMSLMLETLEKMERRSQLDIISDLVTRVDNITIQGIVNQINTPNRDSLSGQIVLIGVVVDKLHKIHTELFDRDYILAIKAYQERLIISCHGDLIRENNVL